MVVKDRSMNKALRTSVTIYPQFYLLQIIWSASTVGLIPECRGRIKPEAFAKIQKEKERMINRNMDTFIQISPNGGNGEMVGLR